MGQIGRWIDEACQREPEVMRHVLGRKFGKLWSFVQSDNECGCLIGSWGIERGDSWATRGLSSNPEYEHPEEFEIGCRVAVVSDWVQGKRDVHGDSADAFVIRLLKQRIRKSLGIAPLSGVHTPEHETVA